MRFPFFMFPLSLFLGVMAMAVSSHFIHHCLKKHLTKESPYWPRTTIWEALNINPGSHVFGFNFGGAFGVWEFTFSVLLGRTMKPIRGWMALWVCGQVLLFLSMIGCVLWVNFMSGK